MHPTLAGPTAHHAPASSFSTKNRLARVAGGLYLALIITGVFGIAYVPATLIDWGDPSATVANIRSSETLFRAGIISSLVSYTCFLIMALVLYELLESTSKKHARWMVAFVVVGVSIGFMNVGNHVNVLTMLSDESYVQAIPGEQVEARVMYLLAARDNGYLVGNIFWGLWLLPFGLLVYRSNYLPKLLGVMLMLGCFDYWIEFVLRMQFSVTSVPFYLSIASSIGEFGICLWLLLVGVRDSR